MPLARTRSVALVGVQGHLVEVEADLATGLPALTLIGLPDAALAEARDRVRAAIVNSGEAWPQRRITVGLSPAALPKRGSGYDLALAAAVLAAARAVPDAAVRARVLLGELGLDGRVRPVRGVLPAVLAAAAAGAHRVVVPAGNLEEARLVPGVDVEGVASLRDLLALLRGQTRPPEGGPREPPGLPGEATAPAGAATPPDAPPALDLADVLGQVVGRRVLEVAAAGAHHLLLLGPPGAGKTMLVERLPGLLPDLGVADALEASAVHSVAGTLPAGAPLLTRPPFRDPHHTSSVPALVGGGSGLARPGEVSLAHRGVLFLDEAPEFAAGALDALRQPLESGEVVVARSGGAVRYPARVLLALAANPCPCVGAGGLPQDCTCSSVVKRRYLGRLSGPLLDRIDLRAGLAQVTRAELLADTSAETSAVVAARVAGARLVTAERLRGTPWRTNAEVPGRVLRGRLRPALRASRLVEAELEAGRLSARGVDRVLRVAWTVADLGGTGSPGQDEVEEALFLRGQAGQVAA